MKYVMLSLCAAMLGASHAAVLTGTCIAVADGDTITVRLPNGEREKVRVWGIDAPEGAQEHGAAARAKLTELVRGKLVRIEYNERDKYHRILGRIYTDGVYINLKMVKTGYAWHYAYFAPAADDIRRAEAAARQAHIGLWSAAQPVAPWVYGHPEKAVDNYTIVSGNSTRGAVKMRLGAAQPGIKYWVSSTGKIHRPGCRYYKQGQGQLTPTPRGKNCMLCGGKP